MPVYILATAADPVGQRLIYDLREKVNQSSRYELADKESESLYEIRVTTLDPLVDPRLRGTTTVYSVVFTGNTFNKAGELFLINSMVGTCPANVVGTMSCASTIVAAFDEALSAPTR